MSNLKDKYFKVLDDGFIALKDYMGSDEDIEQAARVSYGKGTRKLSDTNNLLRYLFRHHHSTPFEMAEVKMHIRAPIYVFRQWHRHRTWSYNEYSGRYSEMIDSCEKTNEWRMQSITNKQGSDGIVNNQKYLSEEENRIQLETRKVYEERLTFGVAKEQARKDLPVSNYTEMYAKVDLKNLLHFMSLRCDSHAQLEIRRYADIIAGFVKELFPLTFQAWYDYQFTASTWTRLDKEFNAKIYTELSRMDYTDLNPSDLKVIYKAEQLKLHEHIGMSTRELEEFWNKLEIPSMENNFCLENRVLYDMGNRE